MFIGEVGQNAGRRLQRLISVRRLMRMCGCKGWHGVMYECVWTSFRMAFVYFVVYIFMVTIVFTSLFVSLIFALYGTMETQRRAGQLFLTLTHEFDGGHLVKHPVASVTMSTQWS